MTERNTNYASRRDSELGSLMPNLLANHQRRSSIMTNANDTIEIRQYMNAAYNVPGSALGGVGNPAESTNPVRNRRQSILNIDPLVTPSGKVASKRLSMAMNKAMNERVTPMGRGGGKHGTARKFCIRVRNPVAGQGAKNEVAVREGQLNPEELKDVLLQQAIEQRRALVNKSLRQGTGRGVKRAKFELHVVVPSPAEPSPIDPSQLDFAGQTSTQQAGANVDLSPFNFAGRQTKALSPMEGVPERLEFGGAPAGVLAERKRGSDQLMPPPPPIAAADGTGGADAGQGDDFNFGYDDYGGDDYGDGAAWLDGQSDDHPFSINEPLPGRDSENLDRVIAPKRKRIVLDPGSRLRKELRRRSLADDANVGIQEVAPGLRRSTRRAQEPLKWWLNEKKVLSRRKYKAMPTVSAVITDPNPSSPWKTVDDPTGARQDKYKVKGPPKKKGPKKGVKQVMATKESTAKTPPRVGPVAARDEINAGSATDENAGTNSSHDEGIAGVTGATETTEVTEATEVTEDEDTLVINGHPTANDNHSAMSDVTLPLGATNPGKASESSKRRSKASPASRASFKSRKSTKSMGMIPEADVPPSSNEPIDLLDEPDDEIIIGDGRTSIAHGAQSEMAADELTLNIQAEPSTATTVDQNLSVGADEEGHKEDAIDTAEEFLNKENASEGNGKTGNTSDGASPSKEPTRRSARNRRTVSSAGDE